MKLGTPFPPLVVVTGSVGHILLIFFSFFFHPDKTASTQELYLSTNGFLFNQDLITPTKYQSSIKRRKFGKENA